MVNRPLRGYLDVEQVISSTTGVGVKCYAWAVADAERETTELGTTSNVKSPNCCCIHFHLLVIRST